MVVLPDDKLKALKNKAKTLRKHIIRMLAQAGSGHTGGSLSAVELVVALYFHKLRHRPRNPRWEERDRFFLSKGHCCPVWYAALAESGYFPLDELNTLRKYGSMLQGHPDMRRTPGVETSSGSLGQGLSIANGMALAGKLDKKAWRVYVLLGDGELQEGQVWEAAMSGAHYKLDNLCAIIDNNGLQIDGKIQEIMSPLPLADKWQAFGWQVISIDGHNLGEIIDAYDTAEQTKGKPTVIIAKTIKGKGVSFMENQVGWHGKAPSAEQAEQALKELEETAN